MVFVLDPPQPAWTFSLQMWVLRDLGRSNGGKFLKVNWILLRSIDHPRLVAILIVIGFSQVLNPEQIAEVPFQKQNSQGNPKDCFWNTGSQPLCLFVNSSFGSSIVLYFLMSQASSEGLEEELPFLLFDFRIDFVNLETNVFGVGTFLVATGSRVPSRWHPKQRATNE